MVPDQFYQEIIRKNERQEYSNGSQGSRHNGAPHFFCSLRYRTFGRIAVSRQTINILKHHDTIIQQHSDGQRHSYQGKTIDSAVIIDSWNWWKPTIVAFDIMVGCGIAIWAYETIRKKSWFEGNKEDNTNE